MVIKSINHLIDATQRRVKDMDVCVSVCVCVGFRVSGKVEKVRKATQAVPPAFDAGVCKENMQKVVWSAS